MNWGLIGVILAAIFFVSTVILSVFLAVRFNKRKEPVWAYKTEKIIGLGSNAPEELELSFDKRPVKDVYRTIFIFFNKGNESIRRSDVARKVTIHFGGADILREPIIKARSNDVVNFSARRIPGDGEDLVELDFDYLDHHDGAAVEVLHTEAQRIERSGKVMGAKEISSKGEFVPFGSVRLRRMFYPVILFLLSIGVVMIVLSKLYAPAKQGGIGAIGYLAIGLSSGTIAQLVIQNLSLRKFPKWTSSVDK